jgi:hypothetical protein
MGMGYISLLLLYGLLLDSLKIFKEKQYGALLFL